MRKKILKRIGYFLGIVLASVLVAFGAMFLFVRYRVEKTGNVLGVSWYNETDKEFTIDTVEKFYEFAKLSTYYNFEEQTVKLGTDLVINEGNAKEWEESTPKNKWSAIDGFAGTFDGQGHTINGLYAKGYNSPTALFVNTTKGCEIRNFKITNSYFEGKGVGGVASVMSNGGANLKQIYSDAIINVKGTWSGYAGGICSKLTAKSTLEECWFDGVINNTGRNSGGIVDDVNRCEVQLLHCLFSGDINSTWSVEIDNASHYYLSRTGGLVGRAINDGARLVINDCLSSGNITAEYVNQTGGVLGTAMKGSTLICNDTFAVSGQYAPVGSSGSQGTMQSLPLELSRERLIGNKAYQWTSLDFENYWSVVEEDTPILKCFSENSPSLEGLQKAYDTSWYSETASESVIMTPEQLYGFYFLSSRTDFAGKTIKLGADIILNKGKATTWNAENAPENTWVPIGKFTGIFDGQGHTISGLYISLAGRSSVGLFAAADVKSEIKDLNLQNSYIQGKDSVGSVVGTGGGTFTNVRSNAFLVAEEKAGGIIGLRDGKVATLTNCTYSGTVSATGNNVGGLIGLVNGKDHALTIQNSTFAGKVHTTADQAGGLIGGLGGYSDVVITGCKAKGTVAADNTKAGGFIGTIAVANKVSISKSSSGATVTVGDKQAGGFIGHTTKETELSQVEFSGKVTGVQQLGGLVGMIYKTDVTAKNANVTGTVSATGNNVGGMIGLLNGEGRKLTISNSTFAGNVHTTADQAGGLIGGVGGKSDVVITGCKAAGTVAADKTRAGGFIGTIAVANKVSISKSLSQTTATTGDKQSGGFVGYTEREIAFSQVQFSGKASGLQQIGGLIGAIRKTKVTAEDVLITGTLHSTRDTEAESRVGGLFGIIADGKPEVTVTRALITGDITYVTNHEGDCGEQVGHIQKDATYIATGVYAREGSCASGKMIGKGSATKLTQCVTMPAIFLQGATAVDTASLLEISTDAKKLGTWVAIETSYPALRIFTDQKHVLSGNSVVSLVDKSWYDSNKNEFVLTDSADLYGFTFLSKDTDFRGKTIKLGATVTLNEGDADTFATTAPEMPWLPISKFAGTFDGQGNSIKGLYVPSGSKVGLFSETTEHATVKNMKLEEAYVNGTSSDGTGSIVGRGGGTFEAIYSDAIVKSEKTKVGGIIGYIVSDTTMNQVQFAGMTAANNQTGGLAATVKGANVTLTDCLVTGTVSTTETATGKHMNAGLLVGMIDANSDVAAIRCLAAGYLKPALVSSSNYARALVGKVTGNNALFHGESVVIADDESYVQEENRGYIGILNPTTDEVAKYTDCGWKGKAGSGIKRLTIENMTGINALYNISGFEFCANAADSSKTWVAMTDGEPQLRIYADVAQIVDLYPHIGWYAYAAEGVGASEENPYKISTIDQLKALVYFVNQGDSFEGKYIQLDAANNELVFNTDAPSTLSEWEAYIKESAPAKFAPIGTSETPFKGQFDGNGCTIKGLYVEPGSSQAAGFFGVTGETATIKNLTITNSYIQGTSSDGTGSVVGEGGGTFTNVHSSAVVTSENGKSGGIIGEVLAGCDTTITDSSYSGYLESSKNNNGGMVGLMSGSAKGGANTLTITDCEFTGSVDGTQVGGFVGGVGAKECTVRVTGCTSSGVISGTNDVTGGIIGKVAATNQTTISNCTVNGTVKAQGDPELYVGETHENYTDKVTLSKNSSIGAVLMDLTSELSKHMDWYAKAENGVGDSESNPYKIAKTEELNTLAYFVNKGISFKNKYIQLTAEKLDFNEAAPNTLSAWKEYIEDKSPTAFTPIGTGTNPFDGNFDGNECTISGIYISKDKTNGVGLFGVTVGGGKISDLTLTSSYIVGQKHVGSIVGQGNGRFNNVHSDAVIIAQECAGGILGQQKDGSAVNMENCSYDGELSATGNNVGGMLGLLPNPQDVSFTNCEFTGNVHTTGAQAGGFIGGVGAQAEINITGCKSTGSVHADGKLNKDKTETLGKAGGYIGIIAVAATIEIENSVSNATVTTDGTKAGGYIGYNQSGKKVTILNSTSGANVTATGKQAGGFVGMTDKPLDITNSQFTGTVTGLQHVAGFIGAANNTNVNITDGLMAGTVRASLTTSHTQGSSLGGLVGIIVNNNANITATRCMIAGTISSATADDANVGEHVGRMDKGKYTADCVYVQKGCCVAETEVGYKATAATKDIIYTCDRLTEVELKGDAATNKAGGLFGENSLWTTRLVGHPVLKDYHWYYANTSAKEFVIDEAIELFELAQLAKTVSFGDKTIYLGQDIVLNTNTVTRATDTDTTNDPVAWTPIGTSSNPFAGTFDGQNHTISGLYVNSGNSNYQGLFAYVGNCTIQKFNISDSYIKGKQNVGSVVGGVYTSTLATIKNITSSAYLVSTSTQMGGMVGLVSNLSTTVNIENCTFSGTLNTSFNNIGGMVGLVSAKTGSSLNITNCDFTGNMSGGQIGGMIGGVGHKEATVTLTGCQINGSINGSPTASNVGGLIGNVALTKKTEIKGCTVQGQVMKNNVAVATKTFIGNIPDTYKDKVIVSDDNTWSANVSTE